MESACRVCHEKTRQINAGHQIQQDWFGTIYAAEREDDPHDEQTWYKANPSLGTSKHHPLEVVDISPGLRRSEERSDSMAQMAAEAIEHLANRHRFLDAD